MDDLNIIDRFTDVFSRYIDSGFGLLAGDVAFLTTVLVSIDIVLAGLFWAMYGEDSVPAQLIRKVLYIGFFLLEGFDFAISRKVDLRKLYDIGLRYIQGYLSGEPGPDLVRLERDYDELIRALLKK